MDRGTYVAASAGLYQSRRVEVVNNNLANVNTPGIKRQILIGKVQSFENTLASVIREGDPQARMDHNNNPGVTSLRTATDFTQGPIKKTGNDLDVALRKPGDFFVVQSPRGTQYTRAGNFTLNQEGQIVTSSGYIVQGDGGAITANGPGVKISSGGVVSVNQEPIGRVQVVHFENPGVLERVGETKFKLPRGTANPTPVENPELESQSLEMSNVSAITSVIDLMTATRGFEMYTKSAKAIDEMNQTAIRDVGKK